MAQDTTPTRQSLFDDAQGVITGPGLIVLFRHCASLGGIGILAVYLQDNTLLRAGWVQLGFDILLFGLALLVMAPLLLVLH